MNGSKSHDGRRKAFKKKNQPTHTFTQQTGLISRRIALDTLLDISRSDAYASLALERRLKQSSLSDRDKAFVTRLVYGTIESRIQLDWLIDQVLDEKKEIEPILREILRMGAFQIFKMDRVPDMASVNESVSLVRQMGLEAFTGMTNAVLRNLIRKKEEIKWPSPEEDPIHYLSILYSAPEVLCRLLIEAWGENRAMEILRYRPESQVITVRPNRLRCSEERFLNVLEEEGLTWGRGSVEGTYRVKNAGDLTQLRAFRNGLFTIQGESSVLAARAVGAKPGQTVLDACAAPGGKSAVLAEDMKGSGRVYAWDAHPHRVELIRNTASRLNLDNIRPMLRDATVTREEMKSTLDAALIDAPCSGTGVMSEKPDIKYRVTEEGVESLCTTQRSILNSVAPMIKPGGTLVYSTCSVLPQENERQICSFLKEHEEFSVEPLGPVLPSALRDKEGTYGLQIFPYRDGIEGFFVCRMRKRNETRGA